MTDSQFVQIVSQKCPSCKAPISFNGKNEARCEHCNNTARLLMPVKVAPTIEGASDEKQEKYANLVSILENSMVAGNYKEAYDYCNKALEIVPTDAALWANKAMCAFMISTDYQLLATGARELITYLNTAKQYGPEAETVKKTTENLAWGIFYMAWSYYWGIKAKGKNRTYLHAQQADMMVFLKLFETSFDIHNNPHFLKKAVIQLVGAKDGKTVPKFKKWMKPPAKTKFKSSELLTRWVTKIKMLEPGYKTPKPQRSYGWVAVVLGIIALIALFTIPNQNSKTNDGANSRDFGNERLAYNLAEDYVEANLKSPSTAEFPGLFESKNHVRDLGGGRYQINSWVDSQNSLGAVVRTKFSCVMVRKGGDTWAIENLQME